MIIKTAVLRMALLTALILGACVSQSAYDQLQAQNVFYGYTDNSPVGPALQRQGILDNLVLSSRRAITVVRFLVSQGINPNIISAKDFGETHPEALNDTPQGRPRTVALKSPFKAPAPPPG